jgi:hypothetical protein
MWSKRHLISNLTSEYIIIIDSVSMHSFLLDMRLRADLATLPAQTLHVRPHKHEWVCFSSSRGETRNTGTINWLLSPRKMYTPVVRLTLSHRQYHPIWSQGKSKVVEYNNTVKYKDVNC